MSLDGRVQKTAYAKAEVYDIAGSDGPPSYVEASVVAIELHPDPAGVIVKIGEKQYLVPDAVIDAAGELSG